jgi:hypothetical protein
VVTFVGKERGNSSSSARSIVVSEFRKRKESEPIVLLVIAEYSEVLFQSLIDTFCLSITFGMIAGGEVKLHVESFSK